ncbi:MAG: PilZ domain-containing protein [Terriglobales bacterium]
MSPSSNEHTEATSRIAPRYQFEARITIHKSDKTATEGWARDLSETGLGAFVGDQLLVGETVTLTFRLTDSVKLVIPAQVVVAVGTRYGFRFMALSAKQREQISKATRQRPVIPFLVGS